MNSGLFKNTRQKLLSDGFLLPLFSLLSFLAEAMQKDMVGGITM